MADNATAGHVTLDDVTSSTDTFTEDDDDDGGVIANIDRYLWIYCSPWILCLGLLGNILIILVVRSRKLHGSSTAIYLPVLAIFDCNTLLTGIIPEWLDAMQIVTIKEVSGVTCKLEKFLFYVSADTATWILVLFTVDRFVAVCFPLKKRSVCTPKCAKIACVSFFLLSVAKNAHVFWTRGPEYDETGNLTSNCGRPEPFTHFELFIRPWIAFVYANLIPFVIIIICNVMIIKTLVRVQKMRKTQTNAEKSMTQTVLMCLSASFTFLVFITPSMALLIGKPYWTSDDDDNYAYDIAKAVNNQLVMVNHSINVILYCASGQKFREDIVLLFKCHCCLSTDTFNSTSFEEDKKGAKLSKQISGTSQEPGDAVPKTTTTMTSLASTPSKETPQYSWQPNGKSSHGIDDAAVEIDLKDMRDTAPKDKSGANLKDATPVKDTCAVNSNEAATEHKDRLTEKDSGIGLKEGYDSYLTADQLSQQFEDDLVRAGDRSSSFTTTSSSADNESSRKDQLNHSSHIATTEPVQSDSEKSSGDILAGSGSGVQDTRDGEKDTVHLPPATPQPCSEPQDLVIVQTEGVEEGAARGKVLHIDNCEGESTDTELADAHASHNQSGKMSPVLTAVSMETTHF